MKKPMTNNHSKKTEVLQKKSLKVQILQERPKLKNKDLKNLKNKFYEGKKNLKNVVQEHEKRHSNKEYKRPKLPFAI
jgi:hypothetical protein